MRHELKYVISPAQYFLLKTRLTPFLQVDRYAGADGNYFIRSIYFDSDEYRALEEKVCGTDSRRKYRLRFYNGNAIECNLECKIKKGTRIDKTQTELTPEQVQQVLTGKIELGQEVPEGPLGELAVLQKREHFHPVVVVDYLREAYVYPASNVRITFDKEIAGSRVEGCLEKKRTLANILPTGYMVLEVKYDEYLPEHISNLIASIRPVQTAASKYVMCINEKMEGKY